MQQQYGMLGPMPWQIAQQQQAMQEAQAMRQAQLTPEQGGVFISAQAGNRLGGALNQIGSAMGLPVGGGNPAMEQAQKMQAIKKDLQASGISPSDTEAYLTALGEKLAGAGLVDEAMNVSKALQAHRDKQADLDIKKDQVEVNRLRAEAWKANKIKPENKPIWDNIDKYDTKSFAEWRATVTDENPLGDLNKLKKDDKKEWSQASETLDGRPLAFNQTTGKYYLDGQEYKGSVRDKSTKVNIGLPSIKIENVDQRPAQDIVGAENAKVVGGVQKPALETMIQNATAARDILPDIEQMRTLAQSGNLLTGTAKDQQLMLARIAATIAPNSGIAQKVNDSDFFDQFAMELVLPKMKMLGGSDSNEELKKLEKAVANRTMSPTQIVRALDFMEKKMKKSQELYSEYNKGREAGRTDYVNFDTVGGRWLSPLFVEGNQVGTVKQTVEEKNATGRPAPLGPPPANTRQPVYVSPPANAPAPSTPVAPPRGNPAFENAVNTLMKTQGLTREQAEAKLMAAKAAKGQ
jgi:hypothetical protein